MMAKMPWDTAREAACLAGRAAAPATVHVPLHEGDGMTLAGDLHAAGDVPSFATSCIDGFAVRGRAPWRVTGRILAGDVAGQLTADGTCVEIATGAMVPDGADTIVRTECSVRSGDLVSGEPRPKREWRLPGEEAHTGDLLATAGTPVTPALIGLAAACGLEELPVRPRPRAVAVISGSELLTAGPPRGGRIRDALGPQLPAWLRRLGGEVPPDAVIGPVGDTRQIRVAAIRQALKTGADLVICTGGTMRGPVDYLHEALRELHATYVVNTVAVRPGAPMLLASLTGRGGTTTLLAGLPGNPQAAVVALLTLVGPALAGMSGQRQAVLPQVELAANLPSPAPDTRLMPVRLSPDGHAIPLAHTGPSMLRGLAQAAGYAVIAAGERATPGDRVRFLALPLLPREHLHDCVNVGGAFAG
jgi:molybdopterin molybdotransferase